MQFKYYILDTTARNYAANLARAETQFRKLFAQAQFSMGIADNLAQTKVILKVPFTEDFEFPEAAEAFDAIPRLRLAEAEWDKSSLTVLDIERRIPREVVRR